EQAREGELAEVELRHAQLEPVVPVSRSVEHLQEIDVETELIARESEIVRSRGISEVRVRVGDWRVAGVGPGLEVAQFGRVAHRHRARLEAEEQGQSDTARPGDAGVEEVEQAAEIGGDSAAAECQ